MAFGILFLGSGLGSYGVGQLFVMAGIFFRYHLPLMVRSDLLWVRSISEFWLPLLDIGMHWLSLVGFARGVWPVWSGNRSEPEGTRTGYWWVRRYIRLKCLSAYFSSILQGLYNTFGSRRGVEYHGCSEISLAKMDSERK